MSTRDSINSGRSVAGRVSSPGALVARRRVTIDFDGPYRAENPETFRDFRFDLHLQNLHGEERLVAPGYFAADGRAGETGASSGAVWRVSFAPPSEGVWRYVAHLRRAPDLAVAASVSATDGEKIAPIDGMEGVLDIGKPTRPGDTAEGSIDLGAAGVLEEGEQSLRFAAIGVERPRLAIDAWRGLLSCDVFDAPATDGEGRVLSPGARFGLDDLRLANAPRYAAALRLVDAMAELAAKKSAGMVRLDLFPSDVGAAAPGPWRLAIGAGGSSDVQADRYSIDVSRLDQWEAFLERLAARGLAVELGLDPAEQAATFWSDPAHRVSRRLMVRELSARFAGFGSLLWRGALGEADRAFAASLEVGRPAPRWGEDAPLAAVSAVEKASALAAASPAKISSPATPAEPPAVSTRPPPAARDAQGDAPGGADKGGADKGAAATADDQTSASETKEVGQAQASAEEPSAGAGDLLHSAGVAAAAAARGLGGLLKDAARAAESISASSSSSSSSSSATTPPGKPNVETVAALGGDAPRADVAPQSAEAWDIPAVVERAPEQQRLRVGDLATAWGDGAVELALYRLDTSSRSPEAVQLDLSQGILLDPFKAPAVSLITRFNGPDAAKIRRARLWLRRLRGDDDPLVPPSAKDDPLGFGPAPRVEEADPFALFSDLAGHVEACESGVLQLVIEALSDDDDAGRDGQATVLRRWAKPVATPGGLQAALDALSQARSAPGSAGATAQKLDAELAERIRIAPQTEAPESEKREPGSAQSAASASSADDDARSTATPIKVPTWASRPASLEPSGEADRLPGREVNRETGEAPATSPPAEPKPQSATARRPVFFGSLVSAARRGSAGEPSGDRDQRVDGGGPSPRQPEARAPLTGAALRKRAQDRALTGLSLRRLELIDAETDRRLVALRDDATLSAAMLVGKRVTVKATLAGVDAALVQRIRVTLEGVELAQRAIDRPQPADDERVGLFYGLSFSQGDGGLLVEALGGDEADETPLFVERRSFVIE